MDINKRVEEQIKKEEQFEREEFAKHSIDGSDVYFDDPKNNSNAILSKRAIKEAKRKARHEHSLLLSELKKNAKKKKYNNSEQLENIDKEAIGKDEKFFINQFKEFDQNDGYLINDRNKLIKENKKNDDFSGQKPIDLSKRDAKKLKKEEEKRKQYIKNKKKKIKVKPSKSQKIFKFLILNITIICLIILSVFYMNYSFHHNHPDYDILEPELFNKDSWNRNKISMNNYQSNIIYINISNIPISYQNATLEALIELDEKLDVFEIRTTKEDMDKDINFIRFTKEEDATHSKKDMGLIGYCRRSHEGYDLIKNQYSLDSITVHIDYYAFDYSLSQVDNEYGIKNIQSQLENYKILFEPTDTDLDKKINTSYKNLLQEIEKTNENACNSDLIPKLADLVAEKADLGLFNKNTHSATNLVQMLNYIYTKYSTNGVYYSYKRTVQHELLHAILGVDDIESGNSYYERARSIMSYSQIMRSYTITKFDVENLIKPQELNILLHNDELLAYVGLTREEVVTRAEALELERGLK